MQLPDLLNDLKTYIKTVIRPEPDQPDDDPDAPFAMVGAKLNPRRPLGHSSVAVQPEP